MFELIGVATVGWIGFKILIGFFKASSTVRSQEFGMEARRIATIELGVPSSYYNYLVTSKMEDIKNAAFNLRTSWERYQCTSWPRLLALVIYGEFHQDCQNWKHGNARLEKIFSAIGVTPKIIYKELQRDPTKVLYEAA